MVIALFIYTICVIAVWIFFLVARLHAYKFKSYSANIVNVTRILFIAIIIFTVAGYLYIVFGDMTFSSLPSFSLPNGSGMESGDSYETIY